MLVKNIYSEYEFSKMFKDFDRDNFTLNGYSVLFDYLNDLSDNLQENISIDVIAVVSDYSEVTKSDLISDFGHYTDFEVNKDFEQLKDYLNNNLSVFKKIEQFNIVNNEYVQIESTFLISNYD